MESRAGQRHPVQRTQRHAERYFELRRVSEILADASERFLQQRDSSIEVMVDRHLGQYVKAVCPHRR